MSEQDSNNDQGKHKTFKDETFEVEDFEVEFNSLTNEDPYVDYMKIILDSDNVDFLKYSANIKDVKEGDVTDEEDGVTWNGKSEYKRDRKISEIPQKLKEIKANIDLGHKVVVTSNISRWTDGENTTFYLTDSQIEDMEVEITKEEEDEEESEDEAIV